MSELPSSESSSSGPKLTPEQLATMTPEEKDRWWYHNVYAGDKMPQLTWRAVIMGGVLGMAMSASNLYTTLTIGWSFGVAITACVMSYVIWSLVVLFSGGKVSQMSLLENNCMQSTASAAGYSTGSTIATMFGALLLLQKGDSKLINTLDVQPWHLVAMFTFCTGMMGVFLAIPMKRQQINHEQLPFPSGIAAAETLRSLYSKSAVAVHKAYSLVIALMIGAIIGLLRTGEGTLNILDKFHKLFSDWSRIPEQIPGKGFFTRNDKALIDSGFQPSVLLIGAGMIVGPRVSYTMLAGSFILYAFVAPALIDADTAQIAANTAMLADPALLAKNAAAAGLTVEEMTKHLQTFHANIELVGGGTVYHVYRWALWGGTALMVLSSLTTLAFQWRTIGRALTSVFKKNSSGGEHDAALDAKLNAIEVPFWWMLAGMIPLTIAMVILQIVAFDIHWYAGIIAVLLSFVLSLVACRATGETDTTPIGAMGKVMQLTFAALHPGQVVPNLASAGIAANSASSSADLLTDLKSGYLLGANPRRQFIAQFFGVFFGTLAIVPVWYLMVPTKAVLEKYPAPGTQSWYRVAQVLTEGISTLPTSAKIALLCGGILGIMLPIIEKFLIPERFRKYFPSAMGLGLSWVIPFGNALAFAVGALIAQVWTKVDKKSCETFNVPIASGFVAGESLSQAIVAMLATLSGIFKWGL